MTLKARIREHWNAGCCLPVFLLLRLLLSSSGLQFFIWVTSGWRTRLFRQFHFSYILTFIVLVDYYKKGSIASTTFHPFPAFSTCFISCLLVRVFFMFSGCFPVPVWFMFVLLFVWAKSYSKFCLFYYPLSSVFYLYSARWRINALYNRFELESARVTYKYLHTVSAFFLSYVAVLYKPQNFQHFTLNCRSLNRYWFFLLFHHLFFPVNVFVYGFV